MESVPDGVTCGVTEGRAEERVTPEGDVRVACLQVRRPGAGITGALHRCNDLAALDVDNAEGEADLRRVPFAAEDETLDEEIHGATTHVGEIRDHATDLVAGVLEVAARHLALAAEQVRLLELDLTHERFEMLFSKSDITQALEPPD